MKNALIRGFLGSIIILLLTGATALAIQGYKGALPAPTQHDVINISQQDYTQARAKWDAEKISVYEISVQDPRTQLRMRVDRGTGDLYLLQLTVDGVDESVDGLNEALSGVAAKVYGEDTVDALFDSIKDALTDVASGTPAANSGDSTSVSDFDVQFDPSHNFPTRFTQYLLTTPSSQEITWRTKEKTLEISDFTVIR